MNCLFQPALRLNLLGAMTAGRKARRRDGG